MEENLLSLNINKSVCMMYAVCSQSQLSTEYNFIVHKCNTNSNGRNCELMKMVHH